MPLQTAFPEALVGETVVLRRHRPENLDALIVDTTPLVPGKRMRVSRDPAPLVDHMPDPSKAQSFRYGVHRALKAIQPDRISKKLARGQLHWGILKGIWRRYQAAGDERRLYSLLGADVVFGEGDFDRPRLLADYAGEYTARVFAAMAAKYGDDPARGLSPAWQSESASDARWSRLWESAPWI